VRSHGAGRERLRRLLAATAILVVLAAAGWALAVWRPGSPHTVVMATGPDRSASASFGERYRAVFAREGIELRLRATAGALENLALLRDPTSGVDAAFAQAGTVSAGDAEALASLGTVFYEPLWLFHRGLDRSRAYAALTGKRFSIGPEGSGTRALALWILSLGGVDPRSPGLVPLAPAEAADRLARGDLDAAAMVASWDSPVVRQLLTEPGIELASFARADALVALNPYLSRLVLPAGIGDMGRSIPPEDVVLVAPKASLVVRRDLNPGVQYLLLEAADEIHSPPGVFNRAGEFPAPEAIDLPLSPQARQFHKSGPSLLHRYLPFWLAVLVGRVLLVLVPVVGIVYPALRVLPAAYAWMMRRRVFRLYGELKLIELETEGPAAGASRQALVARLDDLEERASHLHLSRGQTPHAYTLRHHIRLIRERLEKAS
jgi:TRAP-type uncharacterized transport system substrate-binding protein